MFVTPARTRRFLSLSLWLIALQIGHACSVPVFRYALERWAPDTFQATIFHRGALSPEDATLVRKLAEAQANITVVTVDLDGTPSDEQRNNWKEQDTSDLPWLYVTYPEAHPVAVELDAGLLETSRVTRLLHSPRRLEISNGLIDGETAYWVQIDSGDTTADDAAWKMLNEQLAELTDTLKLPTLEQEDIDNGLVSVGQDDLKLSFNAKRIARDSVEEEFFVRMLLDSEEDLLGLDEPMIFPIFGRGRALYALVGTGISAHTLKEAAAYVVGACSCQVKAENPGVDLLMTAAWDELVQSSFIKEQPMPELTGLVKPKTTPTEPITAATSSEPEELPAALGLDPPAPTTIKSDSKLILWITIPALLLMLVLSIGSMIVLRKPSV